MTVRELRDYLPDHEDFNDYVVEIDYGWVTAYAVAVVEIDGDMLLLFCYEREKATKVSTLWAICNNDELRDKTVRLKWGPEVKVTLAPIDNIEKTVTLHLDV